MFEFNNRLIVILWLAVFPGFVVGHSYAQQQADANVPDQETSVSEEDTADPNGQDSSQDDKESSKKAEESDPNAVAEEPPPPPEKVSTDKTDIEELIVESKQAVDPKVLKEHEEKKKAKEAEKAAKAEEEELKKAEESDPNAVAEEPPPPPEKVSTDKTDIEELLVESKQAVDPKVLKEHEEKKKAKEAEKAAKTEKEEPKEPPVEKPEEPEPEEEKPLVPEPEPVPEEAEAVTEDSTDVEELIEEVEVTPRQRFEDEYIQKALAPYYSFKKHLYEKRRISLATEQVFIYQHATGGRNPNEHSLYNLSVFGLWELSRKEEEDRGVVGFLFEQRNNLNGLSVETFSQEVGSTFRTHTLQTSENSRTAFRQLWWRKKFADDKLTLTLGKLHHSSYYNRNRYAGSSRTHFMAAPFARNPNRLLPRDGLGANVQIKPNDNYYLSLGFGDARSDLKSTGFDTISEKDFVRMAEIGFTPEKANYRFTLWHTDETVIDDVVSESGAGFAFSFDQEIHKRVGIFGRYGYTEEQVDEMTHFVSGGFVFQDPWGISGDLAGCGISWDKNSTTDKDEFAFEIFHRMQATKMIQLTPSLLVVFEPTRTNKTEPVAVLGLRARMLF